MVVKKPEIKIKNHSGHEKTHEFCQKNKEKVKRTKKNKIKVRKKIKIEKK